MRQGPTIEAAEPRRSALLSGFLSASSSFVDLSKDPLQKLPDPSRGLFLGDGPDARGEEAAGGLLRESSPVPVPRVDDQALGLRRGEELRQVKRAEDVEGEERRGDLAIERGGPVTVFSQEAIGRGQGLRAIEESAEAHESVTEEIPTQRGPSGVARPGDRVCGREAGVLAPGVEADGLAGKGAGRPECLEHPAEVPGLAADEVLSQQKAHGEHPAGLIGGRLADTARVHAADRPAPGVCRFDKRVRGEHLLPAVVEGDEHALDLARRPQQECGDVEARLRRHQQPLDPAAAEVHPGRRCRRRRAEDPFEIEPRWRGRQVMRQPQYRLDHRRAGRLVPARREAAQLLGIGGQGLRGGLRVRPAITASHQPAEEPAVCRLALPALVTVAFRFVHHQADLVPCAVRVVERAAVRGDLSDAGQREALVPRGCDDQDRLRGRHRQQFVVIGVADQAGDEVAVLGRVVPVERPAGADLLRELAGADHRHGRGDPVVEGRGHPGVVTAARGPRHPDPLGIDLGTREQVFQRTAGLVLGETLLGDADQERLGAAMVAG